MARRTLNQLKLTRAVQVDRGAFLIGIPKRLALMRGLEAGQEVEWRIRSDGKLELII